MSAEHEIHSLLSNSQTPDYLSSYSDSQVSWFAPVSSAPYDTQITWNLSNLRQKFWTPADSYIVLPLTVAVVSSLANTGAQELSLKSSVCDLISGILLQDGSGFTIANDNNQMRYNDIRLKLAHDAEFLSEADGAKLLYALDTVDGTARVVSTVGSVNPSANIATNFGFRDRVYLFKQQSEVVRTGANAPFTDTYRLIVSIPLRYIHSVFESLNFPIINSNFQFSLILNQGTVYSPWSANTTTPTDVASITTTIGNSVSVAGITVSQPRFYANIVSFQPQLAQKLAQQLKSGIVKKVHFTDSDFRSIATNQTSLNGNQNISNGVVRPSRLFLLSPPVNSLTGSGLATNIGRLTQLQAFINNQPVFNLNVETEEELYELLRDEFANSGSDIAPGGYSMSKWMDGNRIYAINFKKHMKDRLQTGNETCSVNVSFNQIAGTACDWFSVLERDYSLVINMSDSGLTMMWGNSDV